jgi:hypothetical protein
MLFWMCHRLHAAGFMVCTIALFFYGFSSANIFAIGCLRSGIDVEELMRELSAGAWDLTHAPNAHLASPLDSELVRAIGVSSPSVLVGLVWGRGDLSEPGAAARAEALGLGHLAEFLGRESRKRVRDSA